MPDLLIIPLGLAVGILVSAPVGPVNIICINRALHRGFLAGITAGLGAVAADGLLATIAGFGVSSIADMIVHHGRLVQSVGGTILVLFGIGVMTTPPPAEDKQGLALKPQPALRSAAATFFITVTNPGAILGMLAIFSGIIGTPMVPEGDYAAAGLLVVSVLGGALAWWLGLAALVVRVRHRFTPRTFRTMNIVSGVALTAFGAMILARVAAPLLG